MPAMMKKEMSKSRLSGYPDVERSSSLKVLAFS
jgi:hypothetical protein